MQDKVGQSHGKPCVFDYLDYREFLKDYLSAEKASHSRSLESVSRRTGELKKSHLSLILNGKRNLTPLKRIKLMEAIGLKGMEQRYFDVLVQANQSKSAEEKSLHLSSLATMRPIEQTPLSLKAYSLLEKWHGLAVRELARLPHFDPNPKKVAQLLRNRLTPVEASRALEILKSLGLLQITKNREWKPTAQTLVTQDEISSPAIRRYHLSCMELARRSLDEDRIEDREFGSINLVVSAEKQTLIKKRIKSFREEIAAFAEDNADAESRLYQLNIQFFRLSE